MQRLTRDTKAPRLVLEHHLVAARRGNVRIALRGVGYPVLSSVRRARLRVGGRLYIFPNIIQHIWLLCHFHVDGAHYPAELALPHIQHTVNKACLLSTQLIIHQPCNTSRAPLHGKAYLKVTPGLAGSLHDRLLQLHQAQKVHVCELLRVLSLVAGR